MRIQLIIFIVFTLCSNIVLSQKGGRNDIRQGNEYYHQGEMEKAETAYRRSLEKSNGSFAGEFNLGDALYRQKKYQESAMIFKQLAEKAENKEQKAKAYHNLGNSLLQAKQYKPSIEAYKNALRNNPQDEETRYNLAMAMSKIKEEEEQQQQQQDKKDDQQQQQEQEKKEEQEKQEKEQQQQDQQDQQQQQQQQQQQPGQLSKEEAERMLDALNNEEKELQEKMKTKMIKPNQKQIEKDW